MAGISNTYWFVTGRVCDKKRRYWSKVMKSALKYNVVNVIFFHNHPSGDTAPSETDKLTTLEMKRHLDLINVNLLDHYIVAGTETRSLMKQGDL